MHPRGVVLELEVLELLELGELDHALVALARLARREAEHDPVHDDVVARGEVRVEADAQLDERRQAAAHPDVALGLVDPGHALQQRALAAAVAPGDPEELARLHRHRDVVQRLVAVAADPTPRMEGPLLERVHLLLGDGERLAHRPRDHHRQPLAADGWSWHGRESSRRDRGSDPAFERQTGHQRRGQTDRRDRPGSPRPPGPRGSSSDAPRTARGGRPRASPRSRAQRQSPVTPPRRLRSSGAAVRAPSRTPLAPPGPRRSCAAATARASTRGSAPRPRRARRPWRSRPAACPGPAGDPPRRRSPGTAPLATPPAPRSRWRP